MGRSKGTMRLGALAFAAGLVACCALAGPASARTKVIRSAPTRVSLKATKAVDGTVTVEAVFTSPEPRCLEGKRFLEKHRDGNYWVTGGTLLFGGPYSDGPYSGPFGGDGFATNMPSKGFMLPVSAAERSPYVWRASWPGTTPLQVTNLHTKNTERHYETTVAAASAIRMGAIARASKGQGLPYYKVAYNRGDKHYVIKCGTPSKAEAEAEFAL